MSNYTYNENTGRYRIKKAEIWFPNFAGMQSQFNQAGKRNFKVAVSEELAADLEDQGIRITELKRRDDTEPQRYTTKIGVYPDSKIFLVTDDHKAQPIPVDESECIDREFRNGLIRNGEVDVKFHVSVNNRLNPPAPYLRLDAIYFPVDMDDQSDDYSDYQMVDHL
jgi:hypothetical protein